jgi:hypothetical protein
MVLNHELHLQLSRGIPKKKPFFSKTIKNWVAQPNFTSSLVGSWPNRATRLSLPPLLFFFSLGQDQASSMKLG